MSTTTAAIATAHTDETAGSSGLAVLRLGFRPFYLFATALALVELPLWVAVYLGQVNLPLKLAPMLWHAHEMLFGFAAAVIVGFLLTAARAWTGRPTPHGGWLALLALLWLAARLAAFGAPYIVFASLDVALLPIVAVIVADVLLRGGSRRNLVLVAILLLLATANLFFHLAASGVVDILPEQALHAALALIVMIECVMAGRVVPVFTVNVTPGLKLPPSKRLDALTLTLTAFALGLWVFAPTGIAGAVAFAAAAVLHVVRQARWRPWVTLRRPILWILHAGYAWIAIGFALLALAQLGIVSVSAGVHALAVGATGGLIIGMITRTARGHTGRPLVASRLEVFAYLSVMTAAVLRTAWPVAPSSWLIPVLIAAVAAWCLAFAAYLFVFAPWLLRPRLDGKAG